MNPIFKKRFGEYVIEVIKSSNADKLYYLCLSNYRSGKIELKELENLQSMTNEAINCLTIIKSLVNNYNNRKSTLDETILELRELK